MQFNESIFNGSSNFAVRVKYPIANYTQCMIDITNIFHKLYQGNFFSDVAKNVKTALFYPFINVIMETMITQVTHLVFHDCIIKCNYILITLILTM